jgi:hypothetical protein
MLLIRYRSTPSFSLLWWMNSHVVTSHHAVKEGTAADSICAGTILNQTFAFISGFWDT